MDQNQLNYAFVMVKDGINISEATTPEKLVEIFARALAAAKARMGITKTSS